MRTKIFLLGLFIVVILQSCTNKAEQTSSNQLSEQMKNQISSEIIEVSNQWINGNKNLNADKAIQFWSNSPDLRFAENGQFFANRDSIYATLNNYYSITNTLNVEWLNRKISPLSNSTALMSKTGFIRSSLSYLIFKNSGIFTAYLSNEKFSR